MAPLTRVAFLDGLSLEKACILHSLWAVPSLQVLENRATTGMCFTVMEGDADSPNAAWALMSGTVGRAAALGLAHVPLNGVWDEGEQALQLRQQQEQWQQGQQQLEQWQQGQQGQGQAVAGGSDCAMAADAGHASPLQLASEVGGRSAAARLLAEDGEVGAPAEALATSSGVAVGGSSAASPSPSPSSSPSSSSSSRPVPASVSLWPGSAAGAVTVDAFSGLPRRIVPSDLPICTPEQQVRVGSWQSQGVI